MAFTVKDLYGYNPNFDITEIRYLTGKKDFKKTDTIDLNKLANYKDKGLVEFASRIIKNTGFVDRIKNENVRTDVAEATHINLNNQQNAQKTNATSNIPMDTSVFNIPRPEMA